MLRAWHQTQSAENSILSYTLLTSELRGYIESPAYYFDSPSEQSRADLDVLMLSQGYRRFDWKQIISGKYPLTTFAPEQTINIAGTITAQSGKPVGERARKDIRAEDQCLIRYRY